MYMYTAYDVTAVAARAVVDVDLHTERLRVHRLFIVLYRKKMLCVVAASFSLVTLYFAT